MPYFICLYCTVFHLLCILLYNVFISFLCSFLRTISILLSHLVKNLYIFCVFFLDWLDVDNILEINEGEPIFIPEEFEEVDVSNASEQPSLSVVSSTELWFSPPSKKAKRGPKPTFDITQFFAYIPPNTVNCRVIACSFTTNKPHRSNLLRHVKASHPTYYESLKPKGGLPAAESNQKLTIKMNLATMKASALNLVTKDGCPFTAINKTGYRMLANPIIDALKDKGEVFTLNFNSLDEMINERAVEIIQQIKVELQGKYFSLKIDTCSKHRRSFLGVNAQYVHNGAVKIITLAVTELLECHTAENINKKMLLIFEKFGIRLHQIISMTVDNASNMKLATEQLQGRRACDELEALDEVPDSTSSNEEWLSERDIIDSEQMHEEIMDIVSSSSFALPPTAIMHVPCAAHTLQLCVRAALDSSPMKEFVIKFRELVQKLRTQKVMPFFIMNKELNRPLADNTTRWSSTYKMVNIISVCFQIVQCKYIC